MSSHLLEQHELAQLANDYQQNSRYHILANSVQTNGIKNSAKDPRAKVRLNRTFSVDLKAPDNEKITDQKQAGFCWMFSTMNVLRRHLIKKYKVKGFELSANYLFFWDKIERAHKYYLDIIQTADQPTDDRLVQGYLESPNSDGGEWDMAVSLIEKYGIVPDQAFPRTAVTNATADFDVTMGQKLRRDAIILRTAVQDGKSKDELNHLEQTMLEEVYRITAISVGVPPKTFNFEYRDDDGKYHLEKGLTPKAFYEKYFDIDLNEFVPVANYPHRKLNQLYTQPHDHNVIGGRTVHYLNLPMAELKRLAIAQLKDGEEVWFGNDVAKQEDTKDGILDQHLYHYDRLFDVDLSMDKKTGYESLQAVSSHAMTLTGVDIVYERPTQWQVQNSWGAKVGESGYFVMSDEWMDEHVDEVIVKKKYLTDEQVKMLDQTPIELQPWE